MIEVTKDRALLRSERIGMSVLSCTLIVHVPIYHTSAATVQPHNALLGPYIALRMTSRTKGMNV
jgi:hypothetical protein